MKYLKLLFVIIILAFSSCQKTKPSGFWLDYKNEFIVSKNSDNGPFGGETKIAWYCEKEIADKDVINYAEKNGWKLIDSVNSDSEMIRNDSYSDEILNNNLLSKLNEKDLTVYKFKTDWIAVKPGNETETDINGFVVLNSERTKLTVYQLWGE
jgi:hypothetical protein